MYSKDKSETPYRFYLGGDVGTAAALGGANMRVDSIIGYDNYNKVGQNRGVYGSMYLGVESLEGYSFEVGAIQLGKTVEYQGSFLNNQSFKNKINMTTPYFGFGYRIHVSLPASLDTRYTHFINNFSIKPFAGLGVGIANNIFIPNSEARAIGHKTGNQIDAYVLHILR